MKKIALIGSFCHKKEQLDRLRITIKEWKKLGVDTMVLSPLHLPQDIIELCDYYYYTKDNPLLHWPQRCSLFSFGVHNITFNKSLPDYGWARLFQMKKLAEIASTYDYDIFYQTEYDLEIDNYVKINVYNNKKNLITRRINPKCKDEIFGASLHFICLDKENLIKVKNHITLERYLAAGSNIVAEGHAIMWSKEFGIPIDEEGYVVDLINNFNQYQFVDYWGDNFYYDESLSKDYKIFFQKNNYDNKPLKFVIYETHNRKVNVIVNGVSFGDVEEWKVYDSKININDVKSVIINGEEYIDYIKKIYKNDIEDKNIVPPNAPLISNI